MKSDKNQYKYQPLKEEVEKSKGFGYSSNNSKNTYYDNAYWDRSTSSSTSNIYQTIPEEKESKEKTTGCFAGCMKSFKKN